VTVIHHETGETLVADVSYATDLRTRAQGLMGRKQVPDDYALVFPFDSAKPRLIHMLGVRTAIDVVWLVDERVERVETLPAWRGLARARADTILELAPGAADTVSEGDRLSLPE